MNYTKLCLAVVTVMAFSGCQNSAKSAIEAGTADMGDIYDATPTQVQRDVKKASDITFLGLKGPVKEARTVTYEAMVDDEDNLTKQELANYGRDTICFNDRGLVTRDQYGGIYVYDDSCRFVRGVSEKSVMKRDAKNRIVHYSQRNDDEDDAMFENEFIYDDLDRLLRVVRTFWESTETISLFYGSDNSFFPTKRLYESYDEGTHVTSETVYRYPDFDAYGNWTEREVRYNGTETEEATEEQDATTWKGQVIEQREILYY